MSVKTQDKGRTYLENEYIRQGYKMLSVEKSDPQDLKVKKYNSAYFTLNTISETSAVTNPGLDAALKDQHRSQSGNYRAARGKFHDKSKAQTNLGKLASGGPDDKSQNDQQLKICPPKLHLLLLSAVSSKALLLR
ncbi:hypothetical protein H920_19211 [Fukomys damarensis]|uniref:Uncharacterized protein n=1 Tax=Fukomys damarensis TaxID=885580 RepID=A0A091D981_FUKDA|nr:hypothetical protein H920_19211 [Fukomys damarensis]